MLKQHTRLFSLVIFSVVISGGNTIGQMITGVWKGQIDKNKVELKIIQKGDSLLGSSYYYESPTNYRRYSIKGYFDTKTNETIWWDDQLIEEHIGKINFKSTGKLPYLSSADFNCPGSGRMLLDGNAYKAPEKREIKGKVNLQKIETGIFPDEWDFIIDNYTAGANDPYYIDSVAEISTGIKIDFESPQVENTIVKKEENTFPVKKELPAAEKTIEKKEPPVIIYPEPVKKIPIEEKFIKREKIVALEIPVTGDSLELRFYDNAEIDGDSISLFLNNKMIFEHILLKATPYTIKIPMKDLNESNELVMVAENLGSIPPNTSYMLAIADNKRYEAWLKSTEETSALIRILKK